MTTPRFFRRLFSCALILTICSSLVPRAPAVASSSLRLGEIAWAASELSIADEWLEIWNQGDQDVSLNGYSLVGASAAPLFFPPDSTIPAHSSYLISNYPADDPKSALAISPQLVTSTLSLSNSTLLIKLIAPDGTEIDQVGDGKAPPAGVSGDVKASMIRIGEDWVTATSSSGFDEGRIEQGTPGTCDVCGRVVIVDAPSPDSTDAITTTSTDDEPPTSSSSSTSTNEVDDSSEVLVSTSLPEVDSTTTTATSTTTDVTEPLPIPAETSTTTTSSTIVVSSVPELPVDATTTASTTTSTISVTMESATTSATSIIVSSSATASNSSSAASPTSNVLASSASLATQSSAQNHTGLLRLNEIMASPASGSEWIEITSLNLDISISVEGLELMDGTGKIATLPSGTIDRKTPFLIVTLKSARLNNSGDTVTLRQKDGTVLNSLTFGTSEKGASWARIPDATGVWLQTSSSTPDSTNYLMAQASPVKTATPTTASSTTTNPATKMTVSTTPKGLAEGMMIVATTTTQTTPLTAAPTILTLSIPSAQSGPIEHASSSPPIKPSKKPSTMKSTTASKNIRVVLQGNVGSPPGLLSSHGFILLSTDGRGLLVSVPSSRKLPSFGSSVEVSGAISFTVTDTPVLKLGTNDSWKVLSETPLASTVRPVDLLAPGAEDMWALVQTTGTVREVRSGSFALELAGTDARIDVLVRPSIDYRTARLSAGDTVRITGLLDMTRDEPRILPRQADDVALIAHVEKKEAAGTSSSRFPDWMPFGAAGLAVLGTEGFKQARKRHKQYLLEKKLKEIPVMET